MAISIKEVARLAAMALEAYGGRPAVDAAAFPVNTVGAVVCSILALWLGLATLACSAAAAWLFAAPSMGALGATLVTAAALLLACWIMIVAARAFLRSKPKPPVVAVAAPSPDQLLAQGLQLFKDHKGAVLLAALVAGMVTETNSRP